MRYVSSIRKRRECDCLIDSAWEWSLYLPQVSVLVWALVWERRRIVVWLVSSRPSATSPPRPPSPPPHSLSLSVSVSWWSKRSDEMVWECLCTFDYNVKDIILYLAGNLDRILWWDSVYYNEIFVFLSVVARLNRIMYRMGWHLNMGQ